MQKRNFSSILIILGILTVVLSSANFKTKEHLVDLGPIQIDQEKSHTIKWPRVIGYILIATGGIVLITEKRK